MERTRPHIDVTLVSPNGSLEALAKTLRRDCSTIDVTVVDRPEDLPGAEVEVDVGADTDGRHVETDTDARPADCIVVCHASDVDGLTQLEAVLDRIGESTPVVVYSLVHELGSSPRRSPPVRPTSSVRVPMTRLCSSDDSALRRATDRRRNRPPADSSPCSSTSLTRSFSRTTTTESSTRAASPPTSTGSRANR
ncbi:hypothetical protein ACFQMM_11265 [Saliphagus sp. GCM10025308]